MYSEAIPCFSWPLKIPDRSCLGRSSVVRGNCAALGRHPKRSYSQPLGTTKTFHHWWLHWRHHSYARSCLGRGDLPQYHENSYQGWSRWSRNYFDNTYCNLLDLRFEHSYPATSSRPAYADRRKLSSSSADASQRFGQRYDWSR